MTISKYKQFKSSGLRISSLRSSKSLCISKSKQHLWMVSLTDLKERRSKGRMQAWGFEAAEVVKGPSEARCLLLPVLARRTNLAACPLRPPPTFSASLIKYECSLDEENKTTSHLVDQFLIFLLQPCTSYFRDRTAQGWQPEIIAWSATLSSSALDMKLAMSWQSCSDNRETETETSRQEGIISE